MSFEDIVEKVRNQPALWQPTNKYYRNKIMKGKIWRKMAEELTVDEFQPAVYVNYRCAKEADRRNLTYDYLFFLERLLKTRWKYLKDQYRKELKKIISNAIEDSHWQHYHELEFLKEELLTEVGTMRSCRDVTVDEDDKPDLAKRSKLFDASDLQRTAQVPEGSRGIYTPDLSKNITSKTDSEKLVMVINRLNKINKKLDAESSSLDVELRNDPDYMFLMSILPTVRKLSDIQKLILRGKMNEWLLEALTQNENELTDNSIFPCKYEIGDD